MRCLECHSESPEGSHFCIQCGCVLIPDEQASQSEAHTLEAFSSEPAQRSTLASRYEILGSLGSGGMGKVYRVMDKEIGEEIALKILRPEIAAHAKTIDRFRNELKIARRISHRNVCRLYHLGEDEGIYYITMEYVPGEDLKNVVRRQGAFEAARVVCLAKQVCEGLAEAHRAGVIHRDLKPQNLMIDETGNVRILDFGIARHPEAAGMTGTGTSVGTPEYMSPEQVEGIELDARSDIYSVGTILFEWATGRVPFEGKTPLSIALKHKTEKAPNPRELNDGIPEGLSRLILKCMAKGREERPQSAEELLSELEAVERDWATHVLIEPPAPTDMVEDIAEERRQHVFVAREEEVTRLNTFLDGALKGHGMVAFVTGEAGSGKSALLDEFAHRAEKKHAGVVVASGKCDAHTGVGDPYVPFREILDLLTGDIEAMKAIGVASEERARRLCNVCSDTARALLETGPDLVGTFVPGATLIRRAMASVREGEEWLENLKELVERKAAMPPDSMLQQSSLFEQMTRVVRAVARSHPLILILDDLHWADSGSINLLFHLGRRIGGSRVLVMGAYRPAEVALGRQGERHPLEPLLNELRRDFGDFLVELDRAEDRRFLDELLDSEPNDLGGSFREKLLRQTAGHPLFTIELLRSMQEQGLLVRNEEEVWVEGPELIWDKVPERVEAVIEERMARLPETIRDSLTLASVEGEEFSAEVVARMQEKEALPVVRLLSGEAEKKHHLISAKGVLRMNGARLSRYAFRHILFQKHLYEHLDEVERPHLHESVGNIIEWMYGDRVNEVAVQLARHFEEAGIAEKAVDYLQQAGLRAVHVSANEEAITLFRKALELIESMPASPERSEKELELQLALSAPLQAARGFGNPELGEAVVRARQLCKQIGNDEQRFTALVQLTNFYSTRAEYRTALELVEQLARLASDDPMRCTITRYVNSWPLLNVGDFVQVNEDSEQVLAFYDPAHHSALAHVFGFDLGVLNMAFGAWALWFLGYPVRSRKQLDKAIALAQELGHPHTLAFALVGGCELYWFLREPEEVHRYTEELVPLSRDRGFIYWEAHGTFYRGERRLLAGEIKEGLDEMHQGLRTMLATGTQTCLTRLYARMGDACSRIGEIEEGLSAVGAAMDAMHKYDERYMEAELYRYRGELLLQQGQELEEVERDLQHGLSVARQQQAKFLELRGVMSLARLRQQQGRQEEAQESLEAVYEWFTEGFETPDLQDAKTLLEQLSTGA